MTCEAGNSDRRLTFALVASMAGEIETDRRV